MSKVRKEISMQILKAPKFKICNCEVCNTIFRPKASDGIKYVCKFNETEPEIYAECPTCGMLVEVKIKKQRKGFFVLPFLGQTKKPR